MFNLKNKILQIIKQVFVWRDNKKDDSIYPTNEIEYNGKKSLVNRLSVYGYNYNPPKDTWGLSFSSQGKESTKFVLFYEMDERKKELKPTEICIQHPKKGSSIYLKEDGDIEINTTNNIKINGENINLGETVKKLVTEEFKTIYNNHTHSASGSGPPIPASLMTDSHLTNKTKAE
jgi:hypothetical protein